MLVKTLSSLGLLGLVSVGAANAQSTATPTPPDTTSPARNPVQGDPAPTPDVVRQPDASARAAGTAEADKQPAGTENGNQPDRASAAGGAH